MNEKYKATVMTANTRSDIKEETPKFVEVNIKLEDNLNETFLPENELPVSNRVFNDSNNFKVKEEHNINYDEEQVDVSSSFKTENQYNETARGSFKVDPNVEEFSENSNACEVSGWLSNEHVDSKFICKEENDSNKERTFAPRPPGDDQPPKVQAKTKSNLYKCILCSYESKHKYRVGRHINSVHNEQRTKIDCQFCDKSFTTKKSCDDHMLKQHQEKIKSKIFSCNVCSYQSTVKFRLDRHINSMHNEHRVKMNCEFCEKLFASKQTLDDHLLKHKEKLNIGKKDFITSKIHKCNCCSYETTNKPRLDYHMNSIHNKQRVKRNCHFCNKSFGTKQSLDYHLLKQHKDEIKSDIKDFITHKIHTCQICPYETTVKSCLNQHIKSNHSEQKTKTNFT